MSTRAEKRQEWRNSWSTKFVGREGWNLDRQTRRHLWKLYWLKVNDKNGEQVAN